MTIRSPLALIALTQILFASVAITALPGQTAPAPTPSAQKPDPFGAQGPDIDWQVQVSRNEEALQKQSDKIRAQLGRLIDLRTEGETTIEEFVEMIQEAQGAERLNVLVAEDLRNLRLPSFDLRQIRVSSAFQFLPRLAGNEAITVEIESATENQTADLISISTDPGFLPSVGVQTHPIKRILDTIKPESLLQTLEKGIQFSDVGSPKVQIALEAETGLLFVKGTTAQLDVVVEILNAIQVNNIPVIGGMGGGTIGGGGMGGFGAGKGGGVPGGVVPPAGLPQADPVPNSGDAPFQNGGNF